MKSIFDQSTRDEIIKRVNTLKISSQPKWGKMSVTQMVRHCTLCEEYYLGGLKVKRSFLGRIIGKAAIRGMLKNEETTLGKNAPTSPVFRVSDAITDLESETSKWKSLIERYSTFNNEQFVHWFFGKMTKEQLGQFIYKHCDHHLRQFDA